MDIDLVRVKRRVRLKQPSGHVQMKGQFELLKWRPHPEVSYVQQGKTVEKECRCALDVGLALILFIPHCRNEDARTKPHKNRLLWC